jgi:hypothetical protein
MSSITSRIEKFIVDHELEVSTDDLEKLVKGCIRDLFEHVKDVPTQTTAVAKEKSEKLDNPEDAQEIDDLRNCTKEVLNAFCKENGLRVGGTKKEVMDRVWRHNQGQSSDEDISPRSEKMKELKKKPVRVKHECCGVTAKGTSCGIVAEEDSIGGKWYCWKHAKNAVAEEKKKASSSEEDDEE